MNLAVEKQTLFGSFSNFIIYRRVEIAHFRSVASVQTVAAAYAFVLLYDFRVYLLVLVSAFPCARVCV